MDDIISLVTAIINLATAIIVYKASKKECKSSLAAAGEPTPWVYYNRHGKDMQEITFVIATAAFVLAVYNLRNAIKKLLKKGE